MIVFEQTAAVLEKRLGFRVAGIRIAAGLSSGSRSSRSERHCRREPARLAGRRHDFSPQLEYELRPRFGPTVRWCDIPVPHIWRCGNQGNVASVLIEKPARGDFLPIVDGGFSLQYSPLLEYREGQGPRPVLPARRDWPNRERSRRANPGAEHPGLRIELEARAEVGRSSTPVIPPACAISNRRVSR